MNYMGLRVPSYLPAVAILPEGVTSQLCHHLVGTFLPTKIKLQDTDKEYRKYVTERLLATFKSINVHSQNNDNFTNKNLA